MADELPLRIIVVNQNEVDAQLDRLTRDRTVGGGGGPGGGAPRATGQVGAAAQQGASAGDAAKTGLVSGLTQAAVQGLRDSIRNLSTSVAGAFDPTQTRAQREAGVIGEGLAAIPGIGQAASQIFKNVVAPQLAVQEQTTSRLDSQFTNLFEAIGLGLQGEVTPTAAKEEILRRFGGEGGLLARFGEIEERRAAGKVGGQLAIAQVIGKEGIDFGEASSQAVSQATEIVSGLVPTMKEVKDAVDSASEAIVEAVENVGSIIKNPLLAARTFVPGLGNLGND